jgi:hypothetical protein
MKIDKEYFLINSGDFSQSNDLKQILTELRIAINSVSWPNQKSFIINPTKKGNGVVPIKSNFIKVLLSYGWKIEKRMSFAEGINPGPVDVIKKTPFGDFVVEWETGNISSSHRALNKIAVGIIKKVIIGGILILPTKNLARYLTDRIGNYEEIAPYFSLYEHVIVNSGTIGVISVDYDSTSEKSPLIPKGRDGNAVK